MDATLHELNSLQNLIITGHCITAKVTKYCTLPRSMCNISKLTGLPEDLFSSDS